MATKTDILRIKLETDGSGKVKASLAGVGSGLEQVDLKSIRANASAQILKATIAGLAGAAGLGLLVRSSLKSVDALAKTSDKLGTTTEALAGLRYAAELSGVSSNTLDMALQRMTRRLSEAADGTGEAKGALRELGLDAQALAAMAPDQAFTKISGAMENVSTQGEKVRLAFKLFDSEGVALVNTLALGEEGLSNMAAEADALGIAVTRLDASKVEAANDAMTRAGGLLDGIGNQLAIESAPFLDALVDGFVDAAVEAGGMSNFIGAAMDNVIGAVGFVADAFRGLEVVWGLLKVGFAEVQNFILSGLADLDASLAEVINKIPGIDYVPSSDLQTWAKDASLSLKVAKFQLADLANAEMPSENFKRWANSVKYEAQRAAESVAAVKPGASSTPLLGGENPERAGIGGASPATGDVFGPTGDMLDAYKASLQKRQAALQTSLLTEKELEIARFEQQKALQDELVEYGLQSEAERNTNLETLREQHEKKMLKLSGQSAVDWTDIWSTAGNRFAAGIGDSVAGAILEQQNMADAMRGILRGVLHQVISTLVEIGVKKAALAALEAANIATSTTLSVGAAAATGAAWATPAALVSLASFGGNAIPAAAGIASTTAFSEGLAVAGIAHDGLDYVPSENTYLLDKGEMVLNKGNADAMRGLLANGSGNGDAPVNVSMTINISAIDARGVDALLASRRGMISNMAITAVRQAMEDRGKVSVV